MIHKILLVGLSLGFSFLAGEACLRLRPPEPDGFQVTRAARRWSERY